MRNTFVGIRLRKKRDSLESVETEKNELTIFSPAVTFPVLRVLSAVLPLRPLPLDIPPLPVLVRENVFPVGDLSQQRVRANPRFVASPNDRVALGVVRDGRRELVRLRDQPLVVVQQRRGSFYFSEVRRSRSRNLKNRVHQVVPRGPAVALSEDILRVVLVAVKNRVPPLAGLHAVGSAIAVARLFPVRVAPRVFVPVIRRERVLLDC